MLAHIRRVKQMLHTHLQSKRQQKASGCTKKPPLQGGFLSSPKHLIRCQVIIEALVDAGASQADIELVASLRRHSTYVIKYGSSRGSFRSTTGIKQGCKLAPSLFSLVTSFIFKKVSRPQRWNNSSQGLRMIRLYIRTSVVGVGLKSLINFPSLLAHLEDAH